MLERTGGDPRPDLERALSLATNEGEKRLLERRLRDRLARTQPSCPRAQSLEVLRHVVLGPVDDAQVLRSTALHRGLEQPSPATRDEAERLDHHPLAAAPRELLPPRGGVALARRVGQLDAAMGVGDEQVVVRAERRDGLHVPEVVLVGVDAPSLAMMWNGASFTSASDRTGQQ
jgi:hypothetical protein